jgi:hypothetical protein
MGGATLLLFAYVFRAQLIGSRTVVPKEMSREEILAQGPKARGPMPDVVYVPGDMARVATFGVAKRSDDTWEGLPAGSILQVTAVNLEGADTWVTGSIQGGARKEIVTASASFLERYMPLVLPERTLEVADLRLMMVKAAPRPGWALNGWLRNISSQTMSQCIVTCVFQDRADREVDITRSEPLVLPPLQLVRFQSKKTTKDFYQIAVQITHATPDGLRNYLSTIVINKSNLE